jgi:hypothetical protein
MVIPLLRSSKNVVQVRVADDAESIEDFMFEGLNDPFHVGLKIWRTCWGFFDLTGFAVRVDREADEFVSTPLCLRACPPDLREQILRTLLDVLRRGLAVKVDVLDPQKQLDLVEQTNPRIMDGTVWYLEDTRELVKSQVAYRRPKQRGDNQGMFISSFGSFGRYLRRTVIGNMPTGSKLTREDIDAAIRFLFLALKRYGIVEQVRSPSPGYQINHDSLRWLTGPGEIRPVDRTRLLNSGEIPPEVNKYFVDCYKRFIDLKCVLEAREHRGNGTWQAFVVS